MKLMPEYNLVIAGEKGSDYSDMIENDIAARGIDNVFLIGTVDDAEKVWLYNHCEAFVFPSLYEGFGLPPLEAMACGCPVLVSDIPVEREVCGDAALYFNPLEPSEILRIITQYLSNTDVIKKTMRQKGYDNIKRFSWENSANVLMEIIKTDCE